MSVQSYDFVSKQSVQQRIAETKAKIKQQNATIAQLSAEGHEVEDASQYLRSLLVTLAGLSRHSSN